MSSEALSHLTMSSKALLCWEGEGRRGKGEQEGSLWGSSNLVRDTRQWVLVRLGWVGFGWARPRVGLVTCGRWRWVKTRRRKRWSVVSSWKN